MSMTNPITQWPAVSTLLMSSDKESDSNKRKTHSNKKRTHSNLNLQGKLPREERLLLYGSQHMLKHSLRPHASLPLLLPLSLSPDPACAPADVVNRCSRFPPCNLCVSWPRHQRRMLCVCSCACEWVSKWVSEWVSVCVCVRERERESVCVYH